MGFFHREKNECENCHEKFGSREELINHARTAHHHHILRCGSCGKEFLHEKERLHHVREENEKKIDIRKHR